MSVLIDYSSGAFAANKAQGVGTVAQATAGYDLANASYDSVSHNTGIGNAPTGITFKSDGTKMFVSEYDAGIYEYSLTTAFDVSTAGSVDATLSFSLSQGVTFKPDGTLVYVPVNSYQVKKYPLSTPWDLSTAGSSTTHSISTGSSDLLRGLVFNSDGSKAYTVSSPTTGSSSIKEFPLSTNYDLPTAGSATTASVNLDAMDLLFNSIGTSLFVTIGNNGGSYASHVLEYSLSTAYDISTLSASPVSAYSVASQETDPQGIAFNSNGSKMYIVGTGNDTVYQYSTGSYVQNLDISSGTYFNYTPSANTTFTFGNAPASGTAAGFALAVTGANIFTGYDIANASYDSVDFLTKASGTGPLGVFFKPDGTKFYIPDNSSDVIRQYSLTTAWDITTATEGTTKSVSSQDTNPHEVFFKPDGTKMFVLGQSNNKVFEYDLSTAWDSSTASYNNISFNITTQETLAHGLCFNPAGTKMYMAGTNSDDVHQYDLSSAWDVSSASFTQGFSVTSQDAKPTGIFFTPDGTRMIISGNAGDNIYQYSLTSGFDISTASYDSVSFSVSGQMSGCQGLFFKSDGAKMYVIGFNNRRLRQYSTQSATKATFSYPASVEWPSGTAPYAPASGKTDVLVFFTDDGGTSYQGFQAGDSMS